MEKYICNTCGFTLEIELEKTNNGDMNCPICKNIMITAEELKIREQIEKAVIEEEGDEDLTPKEDALEEKQFVYELAEAKILEDFKKGIEKLGNDKAWQVVEHISPLVTRLAYRKFFFKAGGIVPEGEPITI